MGGNVSKSVVSGATNSSTSDAYVSHSQSQETLIKTISEQDEVGVRVLIENGAMTHEFAGTARPAIIALRLPNVAIARMILKADLLRGVKPEYMHLREAMGRDLGGPYLEIIKLLVQEFGIDLCKDKVCIARAVTSGKLEVVAFFLEMGVDPNIVWKKEFTEKSNQNFTPLHFLSEISDEEKAIEIAKILIKAGGKLGATNKEGKTPVELLKVKKPQFKNLARILEEYAMQQPSPIVATSSVEMQGDKGIITEAINRI